MGLSLTMPLKEIAFTVATDISAVAKLTGSINTLLLGDGIQAENTDVLGIERAILESTQSSGQLTGKFTILGSGATARSAIVAAANLGADEVCVVARNQSAIQQCAELANSLGITCSHKSLAEAQFSDSVVTINTTPAGVADTLNIDTCTGLLLDVIYHPWPTVFARHWMQAGGATCSGHLMLLHQAAEQVRLMTGLQPPIEAMRKALEQAINDL